MLHTTSPPREWLTVHHLGVTCLTPAPVQSVTYNIESHMPPIQLDQVGVQHMLLVLGL